MTWMYTTLIPIFEGTITILFGLLHESGQDYRVSPIRKDSVEGPPAMNIQRILSKRF